MKIELTVESATVVLNQYRSDTCYIRFVLPSTFPKTTDQDLMVTFHAEKDTGVEYIKKNFGVDPEIVNS